MIDEVLGLEELEIMKRNEERARLLCDLKLRQLIETKCKVEMA